MGNVMKKLKCGSCSACCQWGDDKALRPELSPDEQVLLEGAMIQVIVGTQVEQRMMLKAKPNGDCVYLDKGKCTTYDARPSQCRNFDCRDLYGEVKHKTFIKVILVGKRKSA